jgi:nijmegen breakage syndrome protein 1
MLGSVPESMEVDPTPAVESQSQGLFVSQDSQVDRENSQPADTLRSGRKRDTPPMDYDDSQGIMDDVAPAAQAFKKRKLAVEAARRQRGEYILPPAVLPKATAKPKTKARGSRKEIDIQEVLAKKQAEDAERAEELARTEREALEEALEGMPIDDIRNLAIIEDMPVMRKLPPPSPAMHADESHRWDERWNGRKNFKKFRRRGADPNDRRVTGRVIVQLEEVKKKDFGIGDEYWLEGDADTTQQRKKKKGNGKETQVTQNQPQARPQQHSKASGSGNSAEILVGEEESGYALPVDEEDTRMAASSDVEVVAAPTRQSAARFHCGSKLADKTNESQNLPTQRASKRAAATMLAKPAPAKKAKPTPVGVEASDDDSEDDGLKFRFARRK